jgi:hypothetical protein
VRVAAIKILGTERQVWCVCTISTRRPVRMIFFKRHGPSCAMTIVQCVESVDWEQVSEYKLIDGVGLCDEWRPDCAR